MEIACDTKIRDDADKTNNSGPRAKVQRMTALLSRQERRAVTDAMKEALHRLAIVGVPNTYGEDSRREKPRLAGRDVIRIGDALDLDGQLARRMAAAVLIPLDRRDQRQLFCAVTLPQTTR